MVAKRLYIALCISASTTLSINCLYLNKIRGTSRSVEDVDSDDQEEQDQEESSVHLIAKPGDEGVGFIDVSDNTLNETIDSTGYVDDGDDSHATDAFNVSNPPTKTVRNLSIVDLQAPYRGLFFNRNQLDDIAINSAKYPQDDDGFTDTGAEKRRNVTKKHRKRRGLPGDGDQCCATTKYFQYIEHLSNERGTFKVVHLSDANQLIPVAICVKNYGVCNGNFGRCVTVKEARPVIVWTRVVNLDLNVTYQWLKEHVTFELFEIPNHCSCSNSNQV